MFTSAEVLFIAVWLSASEMNTKCKLKCHDIQQVKTLTNVSTTKHEDG